MDALDSCGFYTQCETQCTGIAAASANCGSNPESFEECFGNCNGFAANCEGELNDFFDCVGDAGYECVGSGDEADWEPVNSCDGLKAALDSCGG